MTTILAGILVACVYMSGGLEAQYPSISYALLVVGCIGLGVLFAMREKAIYDDQVHPAFNGELTLGQLKDSVIENDIVLFVENPFTPISGWFKARIGGRTVLVMERSHQANG